jgi:hypothetical protein
LRIRGLEAVQVALPQWCSDDRCGPTTLIPNARARTRRHPQSATAPRRASAEVRTQQARGGAVIDGALVGSGAHHDHVLSPANAQVPHAAAGQRRDL